MPPTKQRPGGRKTAGWNSLSSPNKENINLFEASQLVAENFGTHPEITAVYIFGSGAKGQAGPLSDIDLAVLVKSSLAPENYFDLGLEYIGAAARAFETDDVDVMILNQAPIILAYEVISTGKLLFCTDPLERVKAEAKIMDMYCDQKPMHEFHYAAIEKRILAGRYLGL